MITLKYPCGCVFYATRYQTGAFADDLATRTDIYCNPHLCPAHDKDIQKEFAKESR